MPFPGIFRVTCDTPIPGLPHVHVYMAEGADGGIVIIDTAMPFGDAMDRIMHGIEWMGRSPSDVERIYLTHAHPDHFGCAGRLQEATGAPVVCHPFAKRALESMGNPDPERWKQRLVIYAEHGWEEEDELTGRMSSSFTQMILPTNFTTIDEGDTVTFGGGDFEIYWTPGHEEGHVVFFRRTDRLCVVGDTVLGKITPHIGWMGEPADPLGQFLDSLEKVAQLDPSLVLPGHGRPFDEGAERAHSIAAHHEARLRRCMGILIRRGPTHALDVAHLLFDRDLMHFEVRLALAETLAHLEYLHLRGRLQREMHDGVWYYEAPKKLIP